MPNRLRRIALRACQAAYFAALAALLAVSPARAQFIGYISPQTVTQSFTDVCIGGAPASTFNVTNLGQSNHLVTFIATPQPATVTILGGSGTFSSNSSIMQTNLRGSVTAFGYFNTVQVSVSCQTSTTVSLLYTGTSSGPGVLTGQADNSSYDFILANSIPTNADQVFTSIFPTPYGNAGGTLYFEANAAGLSGASLVLQIVSNTGISEQTLTFPLANVIASQSFQVPAIPATQLFVSYDHGSSSAADTFILEYAFNKPGLTNPLAGISTHIAGTSATEVKARYGVLTKVIVNTPAAGTISLFDLSTGDCTMTPSTNTLAVITATSTAPVATLAYDLFFNNGLCVKASSASIDFTVVTQ